MATVHREKGDVDVENPDQVSELLAKLPLLGESFEVHRKIGEGTFSSVYLGSLRSDTGLRDTQKKFFAIKHLLPTAHPTRVAHELRCLRDIGGKNNVIGVTWCLRNLDSVAFIMPYIPHAKFSEYLGDMDVDEIRQYMRALLTALRHVHSYGVIHRDVKPSNFLYNREKRIYALVDFGLAQHTNPPDETAQPPPAHQSRKRPREQESPLPYAKRLAMDMFDRVWVPSANAVLFKHAEQSTAVDVWACGVVLASLLTGRYPFFRAADDLKALREITVVLGSRSMNRAATALGCRLVTSSHEPGLCLRKLAARLSGASAPGTVYDGPLPAGVCADCRLPRAHCICLDPSGLEHEVVPGRSFADFPDSAFALAYRLLEPDPEARVTANEALSHPFLSQT